MRHSRLIGIACIIAAVVFGLLALLSDSVSFVGAMMPVALLGFGIAVLTRPYVIVDDDAVIVKALIGSAQEMYPLSAADLLEFDGTRVFLVNESGRRRLRGVTGWLASSRDWAAFRAWAEGRNARSSSATTNDCRPRGGHMPRERRLFLSLAILVSLAVTSPAFPQQPPPGYQFFSGAPHVSGGLLVARAQRASSAIQALSQGFRDTARFFDGRPQVVAGVADTRDQQAEAAFRVSKGNVPLVGVGMAVIEGGTVTLALAFDTPNTFPQSFPRLVQIAGLSGGSDSGACPPPAHTWRTVPYFDGSGQMTLPQGWQLTAAHQGVARAEGPHGIVESGITFSAISRAGAEQRARFGLPTLVLVADPTDLPSALVGVWTAVVRQGLTPPFRIRRVIESLPVPSQSAIPMQAGFLHYEIEHEGIVKRVLALVNMAALDADGQWVYFESHVIAPLSCFGPNLPTLFQIWTSAQVSPQEFQRRLEGAMSSLHEAHEMHWQGMRNRSRRHDDMYAAWRAQHIGVQVVEDTIGGTRRHVDHGHSTELVRWLNQQEPGRYREVPLRELNQ